MRKAPFSTPRGNTSGGNRQGFGWQSHEHRNSRGYSQRNISFQVYPSNSSQEVSAGDFIPFNSTPLSPHEGNSTPKNYYNRNSTPTSHYDRNKQRNFHGGRGGRNRSFCGTPGFYNDNRSPRGNFNSFSPYNNRRGQQRDHKSEVAAMRSKPISEIINLSSILEDPWRKIMSNCSNSTEEEEKNESNVSINLETMETSQQESVLEDSREDERAEDEREGNSDLLSSG